MTQAVDEEPVMVCSSKAVPSKGGGGGIHVHGQQCLLGDLPKQHCNCGTILSRQIIRRIKGRSMLWIIALLDATRG